MEISIRKIGNSQGITLPKVILSQLGFTNSVELSVEDDRIVLKKPKTLKRVGWLEASEKIAVAGDDALVMPEFPNLDDEDLVW